MRERRGLLATRPRRHTAHAAEYYRRWAPRVGPVPAARYAIAAEDLMLARVILLATTACLLVSIHFTRRAALTYVLELLYFIGFGLVVRSAINQRRARRLAAEALGVEPRVMRSMTVSAAIYAKWCAQHGIPEHPFAAEAGGSSLEEAIAAGRRAQ